VPSVRDAGAVAPESSAGRLRPFVAYARKVFRLDSLLDGCRDRRRTPEVSAALVARIVFLAGLLRVRSFNALEPKLAEQSMQRLLGLPVSPGTNVCSADTLGYALARMDVASTRQAVETSIRKAERNKVFREGWHAAMRYVALDGWEPIASRHRHCPACLTREVRVGKKTVTEYYHRYVVALLVDERLDVVLGLEPVRSADVRKEAGETGEPGHEGELTAAKRLVQHLRQTYGTWIDVLLVDALYPNGPFLNVAREAGYGVIAIVKKETDEPLKDALALWGDRPADTALDDPERSEHIELWDCPGIQTLSTYNGPIRVVRAHVTHEDRPGAPRTWCVAVAGAADRLSAFRVLQLARARWHIENTAFHQWTRHWHFTHVFCHAGIDPLLWLFILAFNLLQFFLYRQLKSYGRDRGKDVTRTIRRLIDEMCDDLARLDETLEWNST